MRIDTKAGQAVSPCTFDQFLHVLGHPTPALVRPPASLRRHIADQPFASFHNVLTMRPPSSRNMADRVARMRAADHRPRPDLPLLARDAQTTGERRLLFAIGVTVAVFTAWIIFGVAVAYVAGRL